jgi:hypothetical protein
MDSKGDAKFRRGLQAGRLGMLRRPLVDFLM